MRIKNLYPLKGTAITVSYCKLAGVLLLLLPISTTLLQARGYKLQKINPPGTTYSYAFGVNNKGTKIVGSYQTNGGIEGFVYDWVNYKTIEYPGSVNYTGSYGVNNAGTVVGDFVGTDGYTHGYLLSNGTTFTQYDVPGELSTSIFGINDQGSRLGIAGFNGDNQGFIDDGGTLTLFKAEDQVTYAYGINNSGAVVGAYLPPPDFLQHGFYRAPDGTITTIDYPGAIITICEGVNDAGEISGYYFDAADVAHGFTEKNGSFRESRLPNINRVNNSGMFVGSFPFGGAPNYGYVALPQPASAR